MRIGLRTIGSVIGAFVLVVSVSLASNVLMMGWQALTIFYGPEPLLWLVVAIQYGNYVFTGVLVFRYLSRLRPIRFALRDQENPPPDDDLAFWLSLAACLLFANFWVHRRGLSLPTLAFDVVLVGLLVYHYSAARLACLTNGTPVVLFLRPFTSFSDRSLVNGLLNTLPPKTQVVFLVPRQESLRNWDPYTIGLGGFRFLEPVRSAPIPLVCEDEEWMECVRRLIERSALIMVDVSTTTASLEIELGLIREAGACSRTVAFREQRSTQPAVAVLGPTREDGWLGALTFQRGFNIPRAALALVLTAGAVAGFWQSVFGQVALRPWMKIGVVIIAGLFVVHHWSVVFLKTTVGQAAFRRARRLVEPVIPKHWTHRLRPAAILVMLIALVALLWPVGSRIYSQHVVIGDSFPVRSVVRLIALGYPADVSALRATAEWSAMPKVFVLEDVDMSIAKGQTIWWDRGLNQSNAIFFRIRGKARVLPSSPRGKAALVFSVPEPEGRAASSTRPRVLVDRRPEEPLAERGRYHWAAQWWTLHESRQQADRAAIRQMGAAGALLGGVLLAAVVGFRVVKH